MGSGSVGGSTLQLVGWQGEELGIGDGRMGQWVYRHCRFIMSQLGYVSGEAMASQHHGSLGLGH